MQGFNNWKVWLRNWSQVWSEAWKHAVQSAEPKEAGLSCLHLRRCDAGIVLASLCKTHAAFRKLKCFVQSKLASSRLTCGANSWPVNFQSQNFTTLNIDEQLSKTETNCRSDSGWNEVTQLNPVCLLHCGLVKTPGLLGLAWLHHHRTTSHFVPNQAASANFWVLSSSFLVRRVGIVNWSRKSRFSMSNFYLQIWFYLFMPIAFGQKHICLQARRSMTKSREWCMIQSVGLQLMTEKRSHLFLCLSAESCDCRTCSIPGGASSCALLKQEKIWRCLIRRLLRGDVCFVLTGEKRRKTEGEEHTTRESPAAASPIRTCRHRCAIQGYDFSVGIVFTMARGYFCLFRDNDIIVCKETSKVLEDGGFFCLTPLYWDLQKSQKNIFKRLGNWIFQTKECETLNCLCTHHGEFEATDFEKRIKVQDKIEASHRPARNWEVVKLEFLWCELPAKLECHLSDILQNSDAKIFVSCVGADSELRTWWTSSRISRKDVCVINPRSFTVPGRTIAKRGTELFTRFIT